MPYMIVKNDKPLGTFPRVGLDHGCVEGRDESGGTGFYVVSVKRKIAEGDS